MKYLKNVTTIYIALSIIVFILGWLRPLFAIPLTIIIFIVLFHYFKENNKQTEKLGISKNSLCVIITVAIVWVFISGIGKFVYQPDFLLDHVIRNSIFRDLIVNEWPVMYENNTYMCYYIGHWIVPAFLGKVIYIMTSNEVLAYSLGNVFLYLWSCFGIILLFIWIVKVLKVKKIRWLLLVLALFIFFSGLDVIGWRLLKGAYKFGDFLAGIEWWSYEWQYSAFSVLLLWVYNQMIVPMLITVMIYSEKDKKNYIMYLTMGLLFGPYPILGIGIYMFINEIICIIKNRSLKSLKEYFSWQNILSLLFILPIIILYFMANYKISNDVLDVSLIKGSFKLWKYLLFIFLEFLLYAFLIYRKDNPKMRKDILITAIVLSLIPLYMQIDFVMRVSIPFLFILWICIAEFILNKEANKIKKALLCLLLMIASIAPMGEIIRNVFCTIEQKRLGSNAGEINILELSDYYRYNYISGKKTIFYTYLSKK